MAPVVKAFQAIPGIDLRVCVTAQHRSMLDQVLSVFDITPDIDLDIMRPGQSLHGITSKVVLGLEKVLEELSPDWVLVHGDTTTAMAATLAAFYQKIRVGHVEAGLRTGDIMQPWPEEMNRRVIDIMASALFAPTEGAKQAMLREGINEKLITVTGNTVVDALLEIIERLKNNPQLSQALDDQFDFIDPERPLILVTGHRRENFGTGFENLCLGLIDLSRRDDCQIVYPVHLNQNVREPVNRLMSGIRNIHLIEPVEYLPFVYLMNRSHIVITDSGGIQEEAPSLGKPVLVTREVTERPEAVTAGTAVLVGTDPVAIVEKTSRLLDDENEYQRMSKAHNPYGDGLAGQRIAERIINDEKI